MKTIKNSLLLVGLLIVPAVLADTTTVQASIQAKLPKTSIKAVKPTLIPELYEVVLGSDQLIYFHPGSDLMIFGEIYDLNGENLTAQSKQGLVASALASHHQDALTIGPADGVEIIEFTDPNCGYCARLDQFLSDQKVPVKRTIFFETRQSPDSDQKAIHILCADDPAKAFKEVYSSQPPSPLINCAEGASKLAAHATLSSSVGVSGTPTVFLDGKPMTGFRQSVLESFLNKKYLEKQS